MQRYIGRRRQLRDNVLRQRLQNARGGGDGAMQLHFPLVLRGQVRGMQIEKENSHLRLIHSKKYDYFSLTSIKLSNSVKY